MARVMLHDVVELKKLLEGPSTMVGSVEYRIKQAIDALINGAGPAYDTLKEIVDFINTNRADLDGYINNLNNRMTAAENSLTTVNNTLTTHNTRITALETAASSAASVTEVENRLVRYKFETNLTIATGNKITLDKKPNAGVMNGKVYLYILDQNGNKIYSEHTYTVDSTDTSGKTLIINPGDITITNDHKAEISYFYTNAGQQ